MSTFFLGALVGFLIGLAICYGKQAYALYQNKDKIAAVSGLADALGNVSDAFGWKL